MPGNNGADVPATDARDETRSPLRADGPPERLPELARKAERAFYEKRDQLKAQSREAAAVANEQMETARRYVIERVNERPFTTTLSVLGAGFLIGLLFAGRRR